MGYEGNRTFNEVNNNTTTNERVLYKYVMDRRSPTLHSTTLVGPNIHNKSIGRGVDLILETHLTLVQINKWTLRNFGS